MKISSNYNQPSFSARFINNQPFRDVVKYANDTQQLSILDSALNVIRSISPGEILLLHGESKSGTVYSNFSMRNRAVSNEMMSTPAESSFYGILELSELGSKFNKLFGNRLKPLWTEEGLIRRYTVPEKNSNFNNKG